MAIAQLSIDLVAKVASFEADLKRAANASEAAGRTMASAFGLAKAGFAGLVGSLSAGALIEFFKRTVDGIDALNDLSDATGASVENLSALEDVAARTGTSMDTVSGAVIKLNKALGDAAGNKELSAAFRALGLSAEELKKADPAEALRQVAVALSRFEDDGNKARIVQELFGKSIAQVAPLLNDLAKQGQLNATVTTEQAKAAEKFNQELSALQKNTVDVARSLAGPMVSALNETIELFRAGARDGKGFFQTLRDEQLKLLGFGDVEKEVRNLRAQLEIEPKGTGLYASLQKQLDAKLLELKTATAVATVAFRPSQNYGDGMKAQLPDVKVDPEIDKARLAYQKLAASIGMSVAQASAEIETGDKLTAIQQLRAKVLQELNSGETKYTAAQKKSIEAALTAADSVDKELAARKLQLDVQAFSLRLSEQQVAAVAREADARLVANESLRQEIEEYGQTAAAVERLRLARLEDAAASEELAIVTLRNIEGTEQEAAARELNVKALRDQIDLRKKLLGQDQEARTSAGAGAQRALDEYLLKVSEAGVATQEAVSRSIGTLEDDLTTSLSSGKLSVRNFVNSVLQEVIRLQVVRPFLNSIFSGGASGGALQALFSGTSVGSSGFGTGLAYGNQDFGGFFAEGGMLGAGKWGIAGERGPEIIKGPAQVVPSVPAAQTQQFVVNNYGEISQATQRYVVAALAQFRAQMMRGN